MKTKISRRVFLLLAILLLVAASCVFASAEDDAAEAQYGFPNGSATLTASGGTVTVTLAPDEDYLVSELKLRDERGREVRLTRSEDSHFVYTGTSDSESFSLKAAFRRAWVKISTEEFGLRPGQTAVLKAEVQYVDGNVETRVTPFDPAVVFASSNPDVATVDPVTGVITAVSQGYSRITASAAGGSGIESKAYVLVDADLSPVVGTLELCVRYSTAALIDELEWGHSFSLFTPYEDMDICTDGFFRAYQPTETYYGALNYFGTSRIDPLTFRFATNGQDATDDNLAVRTAYANSLFTEVPVGENNYVHVKAGTIVSFGCTSDITIKNGLDEFLKNSDFAETIERAGGIDYYLPLVWKLYTGRMTEEEFRREASRLPAELVFDWLNGFDPLNGHEYPGGVALNDELYHQALSQDQSHNLCAKVEITQIELDAMLDYMTYRNVFTFFGRNCTRTASDEWNLVTVFRPELHLEPNFGSVTTATAIPVVLQNKIVGKSIFFEHDDTVQFDYQKPVLRSEATGSQRGLSQQQTYYKAAAGAVITTDVVVKTAETVGFLVHAPKMIANAVEITKQHVQTAAKISETAIKTTNFIVRSAVRFNARVIGYVFGH